MKYFLIIVIGLIAYLNCLPNAMFWDDYDFILNNDYIKDFHYWPMWFSQNVIAGSHLVSNYYRPILLAVFAVEWHLFHTWVYGWHMVNIIFHIACAILVYELINKLIKNSSVAFWTSILFVSHPLHNEAVVYVNSLGDSLSTLFVLSCLLTYAYSKTAWSLILFVLALLSKETAFALVGLLPLMDLLFTKKKEFYPFLFVGGIYVFLRLTALNFQNTLNFYGNLVIPIQDRIFTFFKELLHYSELLICPYPLRVERLMPWNTYINFEVVLGLLIFSLCATLVFVNWKKNPLIAFGVCWFFIALMPAANLFVPINAVFYEHFMYCPMIGIALIMARYSSKYLLALFVVMFLIVNIQREFDWRTPVRFYEKILTYQPHDYRVLNNLGMAYADQKNNIKAEDCFVKAVLIDPHNSIAFHNLANTFESE